MRTYCVRCLAVLITACAAWAPPHAQAEERQSSAYVQEPVTSEAASNPDVRFATLSPHALRVDYEAEPNNLAPAGRPHFTWRVPMAARGDRQTAYRLRIASSKAELEAGEAHVWDSGKVDASTSTTAPYEGPSLDEDTTYYWQVRVWNQHGEPSAWSGARSFTTAIEPDSWQGAWITHKPEAGPLAKRGDYVIEATFEVVEGAAGFVFRAHNAGNFYENGNALYFWQVKRGDAGAPTLRPHVREDGEDTVLDEIDMSEALGPPPNRIRIKCEGRTITTWINGEQVDDRKVAQKSAGKVGFRQSQSGEYVRVTSFKLRDLDGRTLLRSTFDTPAGNPFVGGQVKDGALDLNGTGVVLPGAFVQENPTPLMRKAFTLDKAVRRARLHVTSSGFQRVYVNGARVSDRAIDPGLSHMDHTVFYSTFDVGDQLAKGKNVLGAALAHGRAGDLYFRTRPTWQTKTPVLRAQLNITFADGSTRSIVSDQSWRAALGPTRWDAFRPGQVAYDARHEKPGWRQTGYDASAWANVTPADGPPGTLTPQRLEPMRETQVITPVERTEPEEGVYVFDLGQMIAGYPQLTLTGPRGATVELRGGERLNDEGAVRGIHYYDASTNWWRYTHDGAGRATWTPGHSYGGFRYIQVEGYPGVPTKDDVRGVVMHTPVEVGDDGGFTCSNELIAQLHKNTRWAMLNCLHSIHEDTPTWEKLGWTETQHELADSLSANFDMPRFWRKFLRDARDSQFDNGDIPYVVPHEGRPTWSHTTNDPGWDGAMVLAAWHAYEWTGDRQLLADHYDAMAKYVRFVKRNAEDGLIVRTGLGDWAAPGRDRSEGAGIVSTATYYRSTEIMAEAARVLGKPDDAARYEKLRKQIKTAFNEAFYRPEKQIYATGRVDDYRQTSNLYPLAFDIVKEANRDAVAKNLAKAIRANDNNLSVGAHGLRHLCPVLSEHGYHELAYKIVTQEDYPSWGHWLNNDVTALLEFWELEARSRTHDFLGSVDEWFFQYLAGISRPIEPAFKKARIKPQIPADLDQASASVQTIRGTLAVAWQKTEEGLRLDLTVPANTTVEFWMPLTDGDTVTETREHVYRPAEEAPGITHRRDEEGYRVYELGGGAYTFRASQHSQ